MKKWQKIDKKVLTKSTRPRKNWCFTWKKLSFFTQKYLPAPQKTKNLNEQFTKNDQKVPKKKETRHFIFEVLHEKLKIVLQ